jgi:hypothetical protein
LIKGQGLEINGFSVDPFINSGLVQIIELSTAPGMHIVTVLNLRQTVCRICGITFIRVAMVYAFNIYFSVSDFSSLKLFEYYFFAIMDEA